MRLSRILIVPNIHALVGKLVLFGQVISAINEVVVIHLRKVLDQCRVEKIGPPGSETG